ncbi:MAG TPA: ATP synthase F1 subunit epsilon [Candidatus Kapabacteria bacterium]|jgi:F-type H+-transporting ATPase subunit epsilon
MAQPLKLQLVTPERSIFDGEIDQLTAPGAIGPFTILVNHSAIVSALVAGIFSWKESGRESRLLLGGGFLEFHENAAVVLASSAERVEDIDLDRAERSRQRAEERLQHTVDGSIDYERARASRDRAKARIAAKTPVRG